MPPVPHTGKCPAHSPLLARGGYWVASRNPSLATLQSLSYSLKSTYCVYRSSDMDAIQKALDNGLVEEAKRIITERRVAMAWSPAKEGHSE